MDWGRKYIGNGQYQYCYAEGNGVCGGYKRLVGDQVVEKATIGGKKVGTIILHQSGGFSQAIPLYISGQSRPSWVSQRDVALINDVTGGLICSISSNLVCPNAGSKTADDVAAAADVVQMAFLVKSLIVAGVSIAAIAIIIKKDPTI